MDLGFKIVLTFLKFGLKWSGHERWKVVDGRQVRNLNYLL